MKVGLRLATAGGGAFFHLLMYGSLITLSISLILLLFTYLESA